MVEHRPVEKLKVLWENLNRSTRKHFSIVRAEKFKTGGGKSEIISTDPIYVRVKEVIDGTCEPLKQKFESDYLPEIDDIQPSNDEQVQVFLQDDVMEDRINELENSTQSEEGVRLMEVSLDGATVDWSSWNPTSLKTPKNDVLNINYTEKEASTANNETCEEINLRRKERAKLHKEIGNRFSEKPNYKRRSGHLKSFGLLAQAKLEYVTMLKNELVEKSQLEKEILKTQLIQEKLKVELLRKQLEEKEKSTYFYFVFIL